MRIARSESTPSKLSPGVRGGTIGFKTLLEGREGSPDNYQLLLADTDVSFLSPRHRHNFDQFRLSVEGATNVGPKRNLEQGDLGYFPEGTYYGPQVQQEVGQKSLCMVVQFGGPSGNGYMSRRQLEEGHAKLTQFGRFDAGVFRRNEPAPDGRVNQDAYEAIWEHQNGRSVQYSRPRFLDPVHLRSSSFDWQALADEPGVRVKHLGSFTEKAVAASALQLDAGACHRIEAQPQLRLLFVLDGTGMAAPGQAYSRHTAIELLAGEAISLQADTATEVVLMALSRF